MLFRTHPIHRLLISLALAIIAHFCIVGFHFTPVLHLMVLWDVFALTMLSTSWLIIFTRTPEQIRHLAKNEDGSILYVYLIVLSASFASIIAVLILMITHDSAGIPKIIYLPLAIGGMVFSWLMVHTTFTFHYARVYYSNDDKDETQHGGGLDFPNEACPDYLDFAYYAFVIGMTFQVSDVETRTRRFRHITLFHSLLSFCLNTFVIALTINLIASLKA
jgi:uncharacterized membrane protein